MTPKLSPHTQELIERLFVEAVRAEAEHMLVERCGNNLPFCDQDDEFQMERIRFAVLRIGLGDLEETRKAMDLAKRDWRDVLVWSGFGNDLKAHKHWAEQTLQGNQKSTIIVVMGVAGSGKTTVASRLAIALDWMMLDADNFHSQENREKMQNGIPLTDEDRGEWLKKLRALIERYIEKNQNMVLACSALKESYRQTLKVSEAVRFVYLRGSHEQIEERLRQRKWHYMKPEMLASQFEILEEPGYALTVDVSGAPGEIVDWIRKEWNL